MTAELVADAKARAVDLDLLNVRVLRADEEHVFFAGHVGHARDGVDGVCGHPGSLGLHSLIILEAVDGLVVLFVLSNERRQGLVMERQLLSVDRVNINVARDRRGNNEAVAAHEVTAEQAAVGVLKLQAGLGRLSQVPVVEHAIGTARHDCLTVARPVALVDLFEKGIG